MKQIRPMAIMRPADARRLWSVGAPSAGGRAWPLALRVRAADATAPGRAERTRAAAPVRAERVLAGATGRAERTRAGAPDRLVEAPSGLVAPVRARRSSRRGSLSRPCSRPADPGAFRKILKKLVPPSTR
ncbi:MAG: hypothetical protein ACLQFX_00275 [Acidimicrobiales bacterium]